MSRLIHIESLDDQRVALFRNVRDQDLRASDGMFMVETERIIRRLVETPHEIEAMLLSDRCAAALEDVLPLVPEDVPVHVAGRDLVREIIGYQVHRGALAAVRRPPAAAGLESVLGPPGTRERLRLLLLEGVIHTDNVGSLFRIAAGFSVDAVVLDPTSSDPLLRKAIRVSMGHALSVPWMHSADWAADLRRLRTEWDVDLVAAETGLGAVPVWEIPHAPRQAVIVGSEGHGLCRETLQACASICRIPMDDAVPSLNVATAAGVIGYELWKRERPQP